MTLRQAQIEEAALLYTGCEWTIADIAEHFEVSNTAVINALHSKGVQLRPKNYRGPDQKVKQCPACLHFLPVSSFHARDGTRLASWCIDCTKHPHGPVWTINPAPLAQALKGWQ